MKSHSREGLAHSSFFKRGEDDPVIEKLSRIMKITLKKCIVFSCLSSSVQIESNVILLMDDSGLTNY